MTFPFLSLTKKIGSALAVVLALSLPISETLAQSTPAPDATGGGPTCPNPNLLGGKLITDVCWECIFPMRVAGAPMALSSSEWVPSGAADKIVCMCPDNLGVPKIGVLTSFWEPFRLVEFTTKPGCLMSLNGVQLSMNPLFMGDHHPGEHDIKRKRKLFFEHYHYFAFPITIMMDLFISGSCNAGGYADMDLMFMSELDPTWSDEEFSIFTTPESLAFANPVGTVACIPDALTSIFTRPLPHLFWCAGSWGNIYPLAGHHAEPSAGTLEATSLGTVRILTTLHRRGFAWRTLGEPSMCGGTIHPLFPKAQYKFTEIWPVAETQSSHWVGRSAIFWGAGRLIPVVGEDPIYLVWRWIDCCNSIGA